ncbi:MAG: dienelactone hydrolase family protein, partial [Planctomycetota bacterium]
AGGHLAAAAATIEGLNAPSDDVDLSARPDALLLFNPVYDNGPEGYGYDRIGDRYREISPLHNIRPDMPPAIVFFGTEDRLVPVATAKRFQQRMRDAGAHCELMLYEGQGHGFFNHRGYKPRVASVYFEQTMQETERFLESLGFLNGATADH